MDYPLIEQYWIWLDSIEGIGVRRFYTLLTAFHDARTVWDNYRDTREYLDERSYRSLVAARSDAYFHRLFDALERTQTVAVPRIDDQYPQRLMNVYDPPATLYVRGARGLLNADRMFAVVGSRTASHEGKKTARTFCEVLGQQGICVVSGLARGIDTQAHIGCLDGFGETIAVLGSGVDVIYPSENQPLAQRILDQDGLIVSEYAPGTQPLSNHFPARNRIISGMSDGILLVEGAHNSGAMITATCAAEQGRDTFAVPGSIYARLSQAPNQLIVDGAQVALSPWDIIESFHWGTRSSVRSVVKERPPLNPSEAVIMRALEIETLSFDELIDRTGFTSATLNSLLTTLELRGIIIKAPGGLYRTA